MDFKKFQAEIEKYCIQHNDVEHLKDGQKAFVKMQSEDDVIEITKNAAKTIVVIEEYSARTVEAADNRQWLKAATILFLKHVTAATGNNTKELEDAQELTEKVMMQFEARMWEEYNNDDCAIWDRIKWEMTTYEPIDGPVVQNHYGWRLTIYFKTGKVVYDDAQWTIPEEEE